MHKHLKVCIIGNGFHSKRIQKILRSKKLNFLSSNLSQKKIIKGKFKFFRQI